MKMHFAGYYMRWHEFVQSRTIKSTALHILIVLKFDYLWETASSIQTDQIIRPMKHLNYKDVIIQQDLNEMSYEGSRVDLEE